MKDFHIQLLPGSVRRIPPPNQLVRQGFRMGHAPRGQLQSKVINHVFCAIRVPDISGAHSGLGPCRVFSSQRWFNSEMRHLALKLHDLVCRLVLFLFSSSTTSFWFRFAAITPVLDLFLLGFFPSLCVPYLQLPFLRRFFASLTAFLSVGKCAIGKQDGNTDLPSQDLKYIFPTACVSKGLYNQISKDCGAVEGYFKVKFSSCGSCLHKTRVTTPQPRWWADTFAEITI